MAILVSGGAGYIGSHTCIELLNAGYDVVVADNYYNASPVVLDRVKQITGKDFRFYNADMTRHEDVEKIFTECPDITAVIQFAAYKAVGESVSKPIEYYYNNLNCTLVILDVMRRHGCKNFVFSSSATVYADPSKAKRELGWVAEYGIEEMCADSWNWQKKNPDGYHTAK